MKYCDICKKDIAELYFNKHIKSSIHLRKVTGEKKVYKCDKCDYTCGVLQYIHAHKKTHLENKDKIYYYHCNICNKELCNKLSIKKHLGSKNHSMIMIRDHPELNTNTLTTLFKINKKEELKYIVKNRIIKNIKVKNIKKPIDNQFNYELYLDLDNEAYNESYENQLIAYENIVKVFNKNNLKPNKFLQNVINTNKNYEEDQFELQRLMNRYANFIKNNLK